MSAVLFMIWRKQRTILGCQYASVFVLSVSFLKHSVPRDLVMMDLQTAVYLSCIKLRPAFLYDSDFV